MLPSIFCLFEEEFQPLSAVRILFLLNIFRTWPFYSIKSAAVRLMVDYLTILFVVFLSNLRFLIICQRKQVIVLFVLKKTDSFSGKRNVYLIVFLLIIEI